MRASYVLMRPTQADLDKLFAEKEEAERAAFSADQAAGTAEETTARYEVKAKAAREAYKKAFSFFHRKDFKQDSK